VGTDPRPPGNDSPGIPVDASDEQIVAAAASVRAGRVLTPPSWKDGARVAVCITLDVDNEFPRLNGNARPVSLSWGEYGATTGLPRILRTLARHRVPGTFFIPGATTVLHPGVVDEVLGSGAHEIGLHGWSHEYLPALRDAEQERELLLRSIDRLTELAGTKPAGFRAPFWEFGRHTLDLLREADLRYDSSLMAMDQPYEIAAGGRPTGMIELPVHWALDDGPYFMSDVGDPDVPFEVFRREFDLAYDEGTIFVLTLHPMISGLRSRAAALDRLLEHIRSRPGVWCASMSDVVDHLSPERSDSRIGGAPR
jgi:peptidoglycan/xylan/chitin deacetylase (PgdA/CDA1 family)